MHIDGQHLRVGSARTADVSLRNAGAYLEPEEHYSLKDPVTRLALRIPTKKAKIPILQGIPFQGYDGLDSRRTFRKNFEFCRGPCSTNHREVYTTCPLHHIAYKATPTQKSISRRLLVRRSPHNDRAAFLSTGQLFSPLQQSQHPRCSGHPNV